jgi:hypothetical protein
MYEQKYVVPLFVTIKENCQMEYTEISFLDINKDIWENS